VLQGLSGTGKGTTVDKLKAKLPKAVTWSNGNVFRSLTLLAVTKCEKEGKAFSEAVLTADFLGEAVGCLSFGKDASGKFDIRIQGYGLPPRVDKGGRASLSHRPPWPCLASPAGGLCQRGGAALS